MSKLAVLSYVGGHVLDQLAATADPPASMVVNVSVILTLIGQTAAISWFGGKRTQQIDTHERELDGLKDVKAKVTALEARLDAQAE